jgi:5-methylcytosine-specific restriction endonuclease McrA
LLERQDIMIRDLYPANWPEIRQAHLERAGYECEECHVKDGALKRTRSKNPRRKWKVIYLQVSHLPGSNPSDPNAPCKVLCASCHMKQDRRAELAERPSPRRRGYSVTTTDRLISELATVGLDIEELDDCYLWQVDGKTGQADSAVEAAAQAIFYLRMTALDLLDPEEYPF